MISADKQAPFKAKRISLHMAPQEVAASLQHLPDMVFFDSSGNLSERQKAAISIIAARPVKHVQGDIHIASDLQSLRDVMESFTSAHDNENPYPTGGACGMVDYDGTFHFGIYPEMLIYLHHEDQWLECGDLSREMKVSHDQEKPQIGEFTGSMSQNVYEEKVRRIQKYISAGDIYQVNLTHRFRANIYGGSLFELYDHLRKSTPSPLAAWMSLGGREVLSSSPETFLQMSGKIITTRPIKGTRPRFADKQRDEESAAELLASDKERAELVMITDLERNDLGQVCEYGSVRVDDMLALEKLEHVYHLVSTVTGKLRADVDHLSALKACFPGGSITGAPKKRSMEIIDELETVPRGLYTGAMGYVGFNGESQFNIPIRTLIRDNDQLSYHVGAGIVADSDPATEYQETLDKAKGIRLAVEGFHNI